MKLTCQCLPIKMNKNVIMIEHNGKIIEKLIIGRIECGLTPLYMIIKPPWLIKQTPVTAFTNLSDMPENAKNDESLNMSQVKIPEMISNSQRIHQEMIKMFKRDEYKSLIILSVMCKYVRRSVFYSRCSSKLDNICHFRNPDYA